MKKHLRELVEFAVSNGATDVHITRNGPHPILRGMVMGHSFSRAVPGTPGDRRCSAHAKTAILRAMKRATGIEVADK